MLMALSAQFPLLLSHLERVIVPCVPHSIPVYYVCISHYPISPSRVHLYSLSGFQLPLPGKTKHCSVDPNCRLVSGILICFGP